MTDCIHFLKEYDGPPVRLMEVCGTHTASIAQSGIVSLLSPKIQLISGPGCPVCVTVTDYIDRLVELSMKHVVVTFGDLLRVRGSAMSLNDAKAAGGRVHMVYSPMDALRLAAAQPGDSFVFAAVGFETTAPVYAMLVKRMQQDGISNLRLLTSLKTMPPVIEWVCREQGKINGFLAPGHVSVITGSDCFSELSAQYRLPFVVAGFDGAQLVSAIYTLVKRSGRAGVVNLYREAVTPKGNKRAQELMRKYFMPADAAWRGMGLITGSGLLLRPELEQFDAGSCGLESDHEANSACCCAKVLTGEILPEDCPLFGVVCSPQSPQGACMVSMEGSCFHHFASGRMGGNEK